MGSDMKIFVFHDSLCIIVTWDDHDRFGFKIRRDGVQELDWCEKNIKGLKHLFEKIKQAVQTLTDGQEGQIWM